MPTRSKRGAASRTGSAKDGRRRRRHVPSLATRLAKLSPQALHQLISERGLEACGPLLATAAPEQLVAVLDLDLWTQAQAGRDAQFDADRFGDWLDVLVDAGASLAARTVASLERPIVIAGLSRYMRVFDPGIFEPTESTDDEPMDREQMMCSETPVLLESEIGGYLVRAHRTDTWDAIVTLLVTLDVEQPHCFAEVMRGCRRLSNSTPEVDGLDDLLLEPAQYLREASMARDDRRSHHGYVSESDARAFLQLARLPPHVRGTSADRIATDSRRGAPGTAGRRPEHLSTSASWRISRDWRCDDDSRASLVATNPTSIKLPHLTALLDDAWHAGEDAYAACSGDLAFLANTLLTGASLQSRAFAGQEAADAAACICNLGLECWSVRSARPRTDGSRGNGLVAAFETGWSMLYTDVTLAVAGQLMAILDGLYETSPQLRGELLALRRALATHCSAGTPWLARGSADVLAQLDMTAWVSVLGLLDECPHVPAAMTALLERRATSVSSTAFAFVSSTAQIGDIRVFMAMLPRVFAG